MANVLLTGASGFLGRTIYDYLSIYNRVITLGRNTESDIISDFSVQIPVLPSFDLVIHAAGLAHTVPKTEKEKNAFFQVNTEGTRKLLEAIDLSGTLPKSFVFISTVAVYGKDKGSLIGEGSPLDATEPYGLSKIYAEQLVESWCLKTGVICTILRLPLLAGANPPGNLRLMIDGVRKGYYFNIAGGHAKKSMVLVQDIAKIITKAALVGGTYNLTDRQHPDFLELSSVIAEQLKKKIPCNIPLWIAFLLAKVGDILGRRAPFNTAKLKKITADLTFDDTKAFEALEWNPDPVLQKFKII